MRRREYPATSRRDAGRFARGCTAGVARERAAGSARGSHGSSPASVGKASASQIEHALELDAILDERARMVDIVQREREVQDALVHQLQGLAASLLLAAMAQVDRFSKLRLFVWWKAVAIPATRAASPPRLPSPQPPAARRSSGSEVAAASQ